MDKPSQPEVKILTHGFADLATNSRMLIPTPRLIEHYLKQSEPGIKVDVKHMRSDLAAQHGADGTCPLTTGIFLRIVTEFANEMIVKGEVIASIAPVWRVLHPKLPLWKKLTFDKTWIEDQQQKEGLI